MKVFCSLAFILLSRLHLAATAPVPLAFAELVPSKSLLVNASASYGNVSPLVARNGEGEGKRMVQIPPAFMPKGKKVMLWIPTEDEGLDSVINIIGLMRTAVEVTSRTSAYTGTKFSDWIGKLKKKVEFGAKKIPPGSSLSLVKRLKGNKLAKRKEDIEKAVMQHNEGIWFVPSDKMKREIVEILNPHLIPSDAGTVTPSNIHSLSNSGPPPIMGVRRGEDLTPSIYNPSGPSTGPPHPIISQDSLGCEPNGQLSHTM
ncbi:hypothetical protein H0H93_009596 [Arthromyces matolae]|nr:hypothetical protein H0H93_009596 [Arthromyces matolae]